jgi:hypothetical protein
MGKISPPKRKWQKGMSLMTMPFPFSPSFPYYEKKNMIFNNYNFLTFLSPSSLSWRRRIDPHIGIMVKTKKTPKPI